MTMGHGMQKEAVAFFDAKWECKTVKMNNQHSLTFKDVIFTLTEMYGDCTAATLYTGESLSETALTKFPAIVEFLSLNGRISCMFTLKTHKDYLAKIKPQLEALPIIGLHIQQSNRSPNTDYYQVTGILKVPSPYVKGRYDHHTDNCAKIKHNHTNWAEVLQYNTEHGFKLGQNYV